MYYVSAQGNDERMINVHYYYYMFNTAFAISDKTDLHFVCLIKLSSADVQGWIMAEEESTIHVGLYVDIKYWVVAARRRREGGKEEEKEEKHQWLIYL